MSLSIRLDAVGGMAGDMFAAAIVDALPDLRDRVLSDAAAVLPPGLGVPVFASGTSAGLQCLRFRLDALTDTHDDREQDAPHSGGHASFRDMVARIEAAPLQPGSAEHAVAILRHLAEAEAAIHQVPVDAVHFHEIGDWDSLMDVTAAGSIAAALDGANWSVSALPRGNGLVRTRHGLLPIPAPATVRLLEGFTWRDDGIAGERVTPTGAAILRHLVRAPASRTAGKLTATGTGAGTRELAHQPNILRAIVFENTVEHSHPEDVLVLEFEVDDMTGEEIGIAADRLRATLGVRDVLLIPALGKKGRPVHSFRLVVDPLHQELVAEVCFTETATIGLRCQVAHRTVLPRIAAQSHGLRVKIVTRPHGRSTKAESDDLAATPSLETRRAVKRAAEEP